MEELKPYSDYKDSGQPWLGKVPGHWHALPNRAIFNEVKSQGHENEPMLSVTITRGIVKQAELLSETAKKDSSNLDRSKYKLVEPGDIAYNKMRAWQGAFGASAYRGIVSPAYVVQRLRGEGVSEFFHHLFRTPTFAKEAERCSYGITSDMWSLRPEHFKAIYVPVPPPAEQAAIVRFLSSLDRRVNRFVRAKRRLIELLTEQKQAVITHAVTRGLNPDAKRKPSGIDWLGDVPEHWVVAGLRHRYDQCLGKMVDAKQATRQHLIPYLRNVDVRWDSINTSDLPLIDIRPEERERFTVRPGDLLVCEGRHLGRSAFWSGSIEVCAFQKALHRLRPHDAQRDNARFMFYCLYVCHIVEAFDARSDDNSIPHLTGEMLRAHRFPFPPTAEQRAITAFLDRTWADSEAAVGAVDREIALLREYRTRLVADVVTGKLDVRAAAAERLPEDEADAQPDANAERSDVDDGTADIESEMTEEIKT